MTKSYLNFANSTTVTGQHESVVIVIDESGSMSAPDYKPSRLDAAREAARALVKLKLARYPHDAVAIVGFSTDARVLCPVKQLRSSQSTFKRALQRIELGGETNMAAGLRKAQHLLRATRVPAAAPGIVSSLRRWLVGESEERKDSEEPVPFAGRIIFLSDGGNTGDDDPVRIAAGLKGAGVVIDTIGIGGSPAEVDEETLRAMSSRNPDGSVRYAFIDDADKLIRKFEALAGHLRRIEV